MTFNFDIEGITPGDIENKNPTYEFKFNNINTVSNEEIYNSVIEKMTANNAPEGYTASCSSNCLGWGADIERLSQPYLAFDKVTSQGSRWLSNHPTYWQNQWVQIKLPEARTIRAYTILGGWLSDTEKGRNPKNFTLSGSNNGSSWIVIDTQVNAPGSVEQGDIKFFKLAQPATYQYYRLTVTATQSKLNTNDTHIVELDLLN